MKRYCFLFLIVVVFALATFSTFSNADTDSVIDTHPNSSSPPSGRGRHGTGKQSSAASESKSSGSIHGSCSVMKSSTNPFDGSCVTLVLILNDDQGNEVTKTRTTAQGGFEFIAQQGVAYHIMSGSKFYEVITPKQIVHGGETVNLQLQQK